jgi:hypothetical protein
MTAIPPSRTQAVGRNPIRSYLLMVRTSGFHTEMQLIKPPQREILRLSFSVVCKHFLSNILAVTFRRNRYRSFCWRHFYLGRPRHTFCQLHARWCFLHSRLPRHSLYAAIFSWRKATEPLHLFPEQLAFNQAVYPRNADHQCREPDF